MSIALIVALLLLVGARLGHGRWILEAERALQGRTAALVAGGLTTAAIWGVWGSLNPEPLVSDEASYLFQAKLFASGRWSAPSPPIPEFFEQSHILLEPRYASKYPPGHALLLATGIPLGLTALMPLLLSGLAGALIFVLARAVANVWVALLTWLLWLCTPGNLLFRPGFFSETTTSALWLASWYAVLQWHKTRGRGWLVCLAAFVGWGAITRPLTMLAFAVPIGVVVLHAAWRRGDLRQLVVPLLVVLAFLAMIPLWSAKITGDWRRTPLAEYTQTYIPWDTPGFGLDDTPAIRSVPADMEAAFSEFEELHRRHTPENLSRTVRDRLLTLRAHLTGGWRSWLLPAALVGLASLSSPGWVALTCSFALFIAYLAYAHHAVWTVYYMEFFPVVAFLIALGLWGIAREVAARVHPRRNESVRVAGAAAGSLSLFLLFSLFALADIRVSRHWRYERAAPLRQLNELVARIPEAQAIVFVRYGPDHYRHNSLIANEPELSKARVWLVYDRGDQNAELMAQAPDRAAYLFDEATDTLVRMYPNSDGEVGHR